MAALVKALKMQSRALLVPAIARLSFEDKCHTEVHRPSGCGSKKNQKAS